MTYPHHKVNGDLRRGGNDIHDKRITELFLSYGVWDAN